MIRPTPVAGFLGDQLTFAEARRYQSRHVRGTDKVVTAVESWGFLMHNMRGAAYGLGAVVALLTVSIVMQLLDWRGERQVAAAASVHRDRAEVLAAEGRFAEAFVAMGAARELLPRDGGLQDAALALQVRAAAEQPSVLPTGLEAAVEYGASILGDGSAVGLTARGQLSLRTGRLDDAESRLARAIEVDPSYGPAHAALGVLRRTQGRTPEAITSLERARQLWPRGAVAANDLGVILIEAGREADAIAPLTDALTTADHAATRLNLGVALLKADRAVEATKHLKAAAVMDPNNAEIWRRLAEAHVASGRRPEAAEAIARAAGLTRDPRLLFELALSYQALERFADAARLLMTVREALPDDPEPAYQLGATLQRSLDGEGAEAALMDYLRLAQDRPEERARAAEVRRVLEQAAAPAVPAPAVPAPSQGGPAEGLPSDGATPSAPPPG